MLSKDYSPFINVVDSEHSIFRVSFQKHQSNPDNTTLIVESRPNPESALNNNNDRSIHLAMQLAKIVDCDPFDLRSRKIINALNILLFQLLKILLATTKELKKSEQNYQTFI